MNTIKRTDVLVLGAGIVGTTLALKLQEQGLAVTLIDRAHPGAATSFGNAGLIERSAVFPYAFPRDFRTLLNYALQRSTAAHYHWQALPSLLPYLAAYFHHSSAKKYPAAIAGALPLIEHSWSEHEPVIAAAGATDLVNQHGWIKVWRSTRAEKIALQQAEQSRDYGLKVRVLSAAELRIAEPNLSAVAQGGVHYPDSRQIQDPYDLTLAYLRLFEQRGGQFLRGDAASLRAEADHWLVDTSVGSVHATDAAVALGPWGASLAKRLGYRLNMGVKRGYHMHFDRAAASLSHVIVDVDHGYALAPMKKGIRLTTGAEFARRDAPPTPVQLDTLEPIARRLLPIGARLEAAPWLGARPCTADMLPIIGPAPAHRGLWFCFGHAHHGLTQAASSGRLLAEMINGKDTYIDPSPYRVDRF
ncbi:MAG: NAD(P)/FAD-dependent oxidoreductase [Burkholderiaceae bacterium]